MNSWGEISYHLGEDLNRLSKLFQQNVLKLQWVITLVDLTELNYEIDFRNPHSLSSEINSHDTSLRQFQFAFDKMVQEFKNKDELFMLSSWRIIASHLIATDFIERELLPASDLHDILKVENKLSSPFIRYTLTEDFMPEYSFKECDNFEQKNSSHPAIRPLFLFPQPREISTEISSANLVFTERVSTHCWDQDYQVRDYFLEKSIPARWVFWDHMSKKWYEHGLFG